MNIVIDGQAMGEVKKTTFLGVIISDVIMGRWRLKSPASPLLIQTFIQAQIKENTKALRHWTLCGEFTGDQWIPRTYGQ